MVAMSRWMSAGVRGQPRGAKRFVFVDEDRGDDADGVGPFVEQLVQDAGVGVLGVQSWCRGVRGVRL